MYIASSWPGKSKYWYQMCTRVWKHNVYNVYICHVYIKAEKTVLSTMYQLPTYTYV